ncbi:hypothetical protein HK096_006759, partial [Nowakowskiella sp. JEL0078]
LIVAAQQNAILLPYVVALVAGAVAGDPFIQEEQVVSGHRDDEDDDNNDYDADNDDENDIESKNKKQRVHFYKIMQRLAGDPATSDPVRLLRAVGAYAAEVGNRKSNPQEIENFCRNNFLRPKAMDEISKLRVQLTNCLKTTIVEEPEKSKATRESQMIELMRKNVSGLCIDPQMAPPNSKIVSSIRQIIISGFPDQIARLNENATEALSRRIQASGKISVPLYDTMWSNPAKETFVIHRGSCLYRMRPPPKWLVYEEIVSKEEKMNIEKNTGVMETRQKKTENPSSNDGVKRLWMKGVTLINSEWLAPLAPKTLMSSPSESKILEQPAPRYSSEKDTVIAFVEQTYGPKRWDLPVREWDKNVQGRHKWFAQALLEGKVSLELKKKKGKSIPKGFFAMLLPYLNTKPITLTKPWVKQLHIKVTTLVEVLVKAEVDSRASLLEKWNSNP